MNLWINWLYKLANGSIYLLINPSGLRPDRRGWDRSVDREHSVHRTFCKVSDVKVSIVKLICFRSRCQRRKSDLRTITLSISFFIAKVSNSGIKSEPFVTLWDDFDGLDGPGTWQACPSEPLRPRHGKTQCFWWPRSLNTVKQMFWRGPDVRSAARAVQVLGAR